MDYLNHNQGFSVQVLHTGDLEERDIVVSGDVKGARPMRRWRPPKLGRNLSFLGLFLAVVAGLAFVGMTVAKLLSWDPVGMGWLGGFVGLFMAAILSNKSDRLKVGVPPAFRGRFTTDYFFEPAEE